MPVDRTIMWLTARQLFARKRGVIIALLALAPAAVALLFRVAVTDAGALEDSLATLFRDVVVGTVLPLSAVVFGTTAFAGEVDDGTLIHFLVKPVPRWKVVLSKYVVAFLSTAAVLVVALVVPWLLAAPPALTFGFVGAWAIGGLVGASIYNAIFLMIGIMSRRALVIGLVYVIGLEEILSRTIVGVKSLSVREFAISIAHRVGEFVGDAPPVPVRSVLVTGGVILAGGLLLSIWRLSRYEVAERL
jgi:ABC-2 type transport system permease protein